jgi:hypothetical protein
MSVKKCPKCGSVWYSALPKCAFCGVEGEEQVVPILTGKVHGERASEAKPQLAPAPEEAPVAVAEATPVPPTHADPVPPPRVPETPPEMKAEPAPEGKEEAPRLPAPAAEATPEPARPAPPLPPAPHLPSATVPVVFGWLGIAAFLLVPLAIYAHDHRVVGILALLAYGVVAPFAPFAWWSGRRYEDRCRAMGFQPARAGRTGRLLGTLGTFVLVAQAALLALLAAVLHLAGRFPNLFQG